MFTGPLLLLLFVLTEARPASRKESPSKAATTTTTTTTTGIVVPRMVIVGPVRRLGKPFPVEETIRGAHSIIERTRGGGWGEKKNNRSPTECFEREGRLERSLAAHDTLLSVQGLQVCYSAMGKYPATSSQALSHDLEQLEQQQPSSLLRQILPDKYVVASPLRLPCCVSGWRRGGKESRKQAWPLVLNSTGTYIHT